jgi:hypothetical protein
MTRRSEAREREGRLPLLRGGRRRRGRQRRCEGGAEHGCWRRRVTIITHYGRYC